MWARIYVEIAQRESRLSPFTQATIPAEVKWAFAVTGHRIYIVILIKCDRALTF